MDNIIYSNGDIVIHYASASALKKIQKAMAGTETQLDVKTRMMFRPRLTVFVTKAV